jgi:DNA-binding response OmpR family regulator
MTCCPNCGLDSRMLDKIIVGPLEVLDGGVDIRWRGRRVKLSPSRRLLVCAIVRNVGHVVGGHALIEAMGGEDSDDPGNLLAVQISRTRAAFRAVDTEFDMIETIWGTGVRWRVEE